MSLPKPPASYLRDLPRWHHIPWGLKKKKYQIDGVFYDFLNYFKIIFSISNTGNLILNSHVIQKFIF